MCFRTVRENYGRLAHSVALRVARSSFAGASLITEKLLLWLFVAGKSLVTAKFLL